MGSNNLYTFLATPLCPPKSTTDELKSLIATYPWFSLAHQLLMEAAYRSNSNNYEAYSITAAAYAANRTHLYWRLQQPTVSKEEEIEIDVEAEIEVEEKVQAEEGPIEKVEPETSEIEESIELIEEPTPQEQAEEIKTPPAKPAFKKKTAPQILVVGGEYFTSSELGTVVINDDDPVSKFIITQPKINPNTSPLNDIDLKDSNEIRVEPMDFVTETLAKIYIDQELYTLATSTYKKLILQVPEKSAYFAAQIKEIKKLKR